MKICAILFFYLLAIYGISCSFKQDTRNGTLKERKKPARNSYITLRPDFIDRLFKKIENGNLNENEVDSLVYLLYQLIEHKRKSITPPVYWYTRKG